MCCHWVESALTERHIELDLFNDKIVNCFVQTKKEFQVSDHSFIHIHMSLSKFKLSRKIRQVRNFRDKSDAISERYHSIQ